MPTKIDKIQRQEKSCIYVSYGMMTFITFAKEDNEVSKKYKNKGKHLSKCWTH